MNKTIYIAQIVLAFFVLTACGSGSTTEKTSPQNLEDAKASLKVKRQELKQVKGQIATIEAIIAQLDPNSRKEKKTPVTTMPISIKDFNHYVEVQGNVVPVQDPAYASSETGGRISSLKIKEGQYVKKGDLIATVNLESIRKSIIQLDESLQLAEDIFKRQENLWKQKIGSEVQYLQAKSQVESLKKNKESLEFELTKANVYAPSSGFIDMVMLKEGEMSGPGAPIVQILNTNKLKVVAAVPEIYLGKTKRGERVALDFPALNEQQEGKIIMIGRSINPANRTFELEASMNSKNGLLKPNLLATMLINDYAAKDAIVVPDELILQDISGNDFVMIAEAGKAVKKNVKMGRGYNNETVIESGLKGDEVLIVKGARQISDGDLLEILSK